MVGTPELPDGWAVLVSSAVWFLTSLLAGWVAVHWSRERLEHAGPITRIRRWEKGGRTWQRLVRVRRWKGRLPQAGDFFANGQSMRAVGSSRNENLENFALLTVRAERVHWLILASTPLHLIWCRPPVALGMIVFGVGFNAPCIVVQRYNRAGIQRVLTRRRSRSSLHPRDSRGSVADPDPGTDPNPPTAPGDPS
ncbi:MAG: hypothetical protein WBA45_14960 [Microthrixaceae bacterium]